MATVRVIVLRAPGINCDEETAFAWNRAGAQADRLHVNRLIEDPSVLGHYQVLTLPGGFSYGDDIASGRILASQLEHHLKDAIQSFLDRGGLLLGICNGFQILVRMGLLPGPDCDVVASLTLNASARFEARWVHVRANVSHCPFLRNDAIYHLPVAHAEGRVVTTRDADGATLLATRGRIALRYVDRDGNPPNYPENPNGSTENAAALTDSTGRVFGLMPHPERNILPGQRPDRMPLANPENSPDPPRDGLMMFRSAVRHLT